MRVSGMRKACRKPSIFPRLLELSVGGGNSGRDGMMSVQAESARYFIDQARRRRAHPTDDLISVFANGTIDSVRLSDTDITFNCFMLIGAGQETTRNAITGSILALLENPAEQRKFVAVPSASAAVRELLRWTSPVTHIMRTVADDLDFRGHRMRAGDRLVVWNMSANRDDLKFPDADRLILDRAPNEHLAFGYGEHFCLGANLARLEMRIMFEEIARRFSSIEHAGPVKRARSNFVAGIKHMPVRLKPRTGVPGQNLNPRCIDRTGREEFLI
jgi:cytochrome P450